MDLPDARRDEEHKKEFNDMIKQMEKCAQIFKEVAKKTEENCIIRLGQKIKMFDGMPISGHDMENYRLELAYIDSEQENENPDEKSPHYNIMIEIFSMQDEKDAQNARNQYEKAICCAEEFVSSVTYGRVKRAVNSISDYLGIPSPAKRKAKISRKYYQTLDEIVKAKKGFGDLSRKFHEKERDSLMYKKQIYFLIEHNEDCHEYASVDTAPLKPEDKQLILECLERDAEKIQEIRSDRWSIENYFDEAKIKQLNNLQMFVANLYYESYI